MVNMERKNASVMTQGSIASARYGVHLPPLRTAVWLGSTAAALLTIHIILQGTHYLWHPLPWLLTRLFDVDAEDSIPTWFSAAILLLASLLLLVLGSQRRREKDRRALHWLGLGWGFMLLSLDEIAGIHESINTVISCSWAIPGLLAALGVGVIFIPFLVQLPRRSAMLMITAAFLFLAGAVGVELATDSFYEVCGPNNLSYGLYNAAEEGLEMFGVILFIYALLDYMAGPAGGTVDVTVSTARTVQ